MKYLLFKLKTKLKEFTFRIRMNYNILSQQNKA